MSLQRKCKNCAYKTWACPGWMCESQKHPKFDPDGDTSVMINLDNVCDLYEESERKIYVAIFNYFGDYKQLAERYPGGELVNGNTLCFVNMKGEWISAQMEKDGCDYNYSYKSPEDALNRDD